MKTKHSKYAVAVVVATLLAACGGGGGGGGDTSSTVNASQTATTSSFAFKQAYSSFLSNPQNVTFNLVASQGGQTATGSATLSTTVTSANFEGKGALAVTQSLSVTLSGRSTVSVSLPGFGTDYYDSSTFQYLGSISGTDYAVSTPKDLPATIQADDNIELHREVEYANASKTTKIGEGALRLTATRRDSGSLTIRLTPEAITASGSRVSAGYFEYVLSSTGKLALVGFNLEDKSTGTVINGTAR